MRQHPHVFALLAVMACQSEEIEATYYSTGDGGDLLALDPDTGTPTGGGVLGECVEVVTKINGTDADDVPNPVVGDAWMIRMFCDDALLTGANRLFFQPAGVATVDDASTDAVFVASGSTKMTMQAGSLVYTRELIVRDAQ